MHTRTHFAFDFSSLRVMTRFLQKFSAELSKGRGGKIQRGGYWLRTLLHRKTPKMPPFSSSSSSCYSHRHLEDVHEDSFRVHYRISAIFAAGRIIHRRRTSIRANGGTSRTSRAKRFLDRTQRGWGNSRAGRRSW